MKNVGEGYRRSWGWRIMGSAVECTTACMAWHHDFVEKNNGRGSTEVTAKRDTHIRIEREEGKGKE